MTLKGFRTILVNGLMAAAGIALMVTEQLTGFNWASFVDAKWAPLIVIGVNLINAGLRYITTTPVGEGK